MLVDVTAHRTSSIRDVIMALFQGYDYDVARLFLDSLRATGYRGRVIVVAARLTDVTVDQLEAAGVELVWFNRFSLPYLKHCATGWKWRRMYPLTRAATVRPISPIVRAYVRKRLDRIPLNDVVKQAKLAIPFVHYFCARFAVYSRLLAERGDEFDRVFLTDVRDVVFQADPFAWDVPTDRLACFSECPEKTIGDCRFNSRWIRDGLGQGALDEVADKQLICAGTTMGPTAAVARYLCAMVRQMMLLKRQVNGIDQGTHNYVMHTGAAGPFDVYLNHAGPVMNLAGTPVERLRFNNAGRLVNDDGSVVAVVHQFDRLPEMYRQRLSILSETGAAT